MTKHVEYKSMSLYYLDFIKYRLKNYIQICLVGENYGISIDDIDMIGDDIV